MTKDKALEKLNTLFTELQELPAYVYNSENKEFTKWERKAWRYIEEIFKHSERGQMSEFMNIEFEYKTYAFTGDSNFSNDYIRTHNAGRAQALTLIESFLEEVDEWEDYENLHEQSVVARLKTKVFIVHGHDDAAKQEVARFIERFGLKAIILHEQASSSKTIIEKIEEYTNDVGFGIVLYTECDIGGKDSNSLNPRARQNVVFEHGYLMSKLGRGNVCPLVKGSVETPGDIGGVVYIQMNGESWHLPLVKELEASGYVIDRRLL